MSVTKQIKEDFEAIGQIIAFTTLLLDDVLFLQYELTSGEKVQFGRFTIMKRMLNSFKSSLILYLCIIYTSNRDEKFRIRKLLNIIINNYKNIKWYKEISLTEVGELIKEIDSLESKIEELFKIRDNFVAHIDRTNQSVNFKLDDEKALITKAQKIHNTLNYALYGATTHWEFTRSEVGFSYISELDKFAEIRELAYNRLAEDQKNITTQELMKIIRKSTSR